MPIEIRSARSASYSRRLWGILVFVLLGTVGCAVDSPGTGSATTSTPTSPGTTVASATPTPTSGAAAQPLQPQGSITVFTTSTIAGQAYELSTTSGGKASAALLPISLARLDGSSETVLGSGTANIDGSSITGVTEKGHGFQFNGAASVLKAGDRVVVIVTSSDGKTTARLGPETVTAVSTTATGESEITQELVKAHVAFLADDLSKGRGSGEGTLEGRVADYVEKTLKDLGVAPGVSGSYRQPFSVRGYSKFACQLDAPEDVQPPARVGRRPNERGMAFSPSGQVATIEEDVRYAVEFEAAGDTLNVIGVIEGTDATLKNEYVVVGGHMDHLGTSSSGTIYNGADDNGSGTAAVLAVARALIRDRSRGQGLKRSVIVALFAGEELGLLGSQYFVTNPTVSLSKIVGMIDLDMIARGSSNTVSLFDSSSGGGSNIFHQFHDTTGTRFTEITHDAGSSGSDHYCFYKKGIPAIFFFEGDGNSDYHTSRDDANKVDYQKLVDMAKFAYVHLKGVGNK